MLLLLAYLFLALFVSFVCSIMESVLLSTPQSFLIVESEKGKPWAKPSQLALLSPGEQAYYMQRNRNRIT